MTKPKRYKRYSAEFKREALRRAPLTVAIPARSKKPPKHALRAEPLWGDTRYSVIASGNVWFRDQDREAWQGQNDPNQKIRESRIGS